MGGGGVEQRSSSAGGNDAGGGDGDDDGNRRGRDSGLDRALRWRRTGPNCERSPRLAMDSSGGESRMSIQGRLSNGWLPRRRVSSRLRGT